MRALSLSLTLLAGCVVGARGRAATNGNSLALSGSIVAPRPPVAMIVSLSDQHIVGGAGWLRTFADDALWLTPYGGLLWRVDDGAVGVEAGVNLLYGYVGAEAGVQQTIGDGGSTGGFIGAGVNVLALCGCL
ncbi:MAG: hypothetical protein JNK64_25930 [Myxococcales bacterium]|nr:hypothetical protein [Myxococcales bacterium]